VDPILLLVNDSSHTSETRRTARRLATDLGFDETGAERVAIAISEACSNLLKHAGGGMVFLGAVDDQRMLLLEFLALDHGPGMNNVDLCSQDGFSTSGTLGHGLGAIGRMAAFMDVYSLPGKGTAVLARISDDGNLEASGIKCHGLVASKPGQDVCGDAWGIVEQSESRSAVVVADGLGHGPEAALAAQTAVRIAAQHRELGPQDLLESIHKGLRHTRGAAVGVAELDRDRNLVRFATIGNISGRICAPGVQARHMVSMNGTAGAPSLTQIRDFQYPFPEGAAVVIHSDGISGRWDLKDYAGLISRDPALISGVLFRDYRRSSDDGSVVVMK
jgi:anti-sigma regulatory factor (Ser/Thr protein kinase)